MADPSREMAIECMHAGYKHSCSGLYECHPSHDFPLCAYELSNNRHMASEISMKEGIHCKPMPGNDMPWMPCMLLASKHALQMLMHILVMALAHIMYCPFVSNKGSYE